MSKMPAKKKSCFQITSVTTAQVASSITEDTESLDDPDESHTEDVSSEIFDVSRATDYGPEDVCERSSSEETLNNVGDAETPGTVSPNLLLDGQVAAAAVAAASGGIQPPSPAVPVANGGAVPRSTVMPSATASQTCSVATGGSSVQPAAGPSAMPLTAAAACSSRFRVIKLDHGTGEPYRRGRWTCMEYYDRDSDGGAVLARTGDCIRHNSTFEQAVQDRDSGLGATGSSLIVSGVVTSVHGPDSLADSSVTAVSQLLQPEKINQPSPQQPNFVIGQQPHSSAQPIYSGATVAGQQAMGPLLQTQRRIVPAANLPTMGEHGCQLDTRGEGIFRGRTLVYLLERPSEGREGSCDCCGVIGGSFCSSSLRRQQRAHAITVEPSAAPIGMAAILATPCGSRERQASIVAQAEDSYQQCSRNFGRLLPGLYSSLVVVRFYLHVCGPCICSLCQL
ncbi:TSC22 domain family protein 2 [Crotalus adamanteus]|uniref:TSC22 domain family protein 2 n=1 Tax=Crotalus adamanteus TaxID=8729 RepID=A0AAW1BG03_CROAD